MYFIAEVTTNFKKVVDEAETLTLAEEKARQHSFRTGLVVEIVNEYFRTIRQVCEYKDWNS